MLYFYKKIQKVIIMSYDELEKYIKASLKKAISDAGNMRKLAQQRGMDYPTIYRFNSGDNAIGNMPLRTLVKLFPDLALFCFPSDYMNSKQPVSDADAETQLLSIFRGLPHDKQLECLVMVAANFGDKLKENEK